VNRKRNAAREQGRDTQNLYFLDAAWGCAEGPVIRGHHFAILDFTMRSTAGPQKRRGVRRDNLSGALRGLNASAVLPATRRCPMMSSTDQGAAAFHVADEVHILFVRPCPRALVHDANAVEFFWRGRGTLHTAPSGETTVRFAASGGEVFDQHGERRGGYHRNFEIATESVARANRCKSTAARRVSHMSATAFGGYRDAWLVFAVLPRHLRNKETS